LTKEITLVISQELPFPVLRMLDGGAFTEVIEIQAPFGVAVLKVARRTPLPARYSTLGAALVGGIAFHTGSVGSWEPEPNAVVTAEATQLARIVHPAFPKLLESGKQTEDGRNYLIMERIEGETWHDKIGRGESIGIAALAALASALEDVCLAGTLAYHGDIKPENIMTDPSGRVRVLDPCSGMREESNGVTTAMMITEDYNPFFSTSDLPALGFTIIEAVSTLHPLRVAGAISLAHKPLGPRLAAMLETRNAVGQSYLLKRIAWMSFPTELVSNFPPALEAIALRCLGLCRLGGGYELETPYQDVGELAKALRDLAATT
jgi:hypothetical protein